MSNLTEKSIAIPHGVVFIYDPTIVVLNVPSDTSAAPILSTGNCISLWTVHEDEGVTALVLTGVYDDEDCKLVFHGPIAAEGRRLAFCNSSCDSIIEVEMDSDAPMVTIYANDPRTPSKVVCVVTPLKP